MAQIVVVVSAPKWANKSFVDHATVIVQLQRSAFESFQVFVFKFGRFVGVMLVPSVGRLSTIACKVH